MDKELAVKWIEALRSGKYKQGRSRLKHAGRHCCLGVLCEVAGYKIKRHDVDLCLTPLSEKLPKSIESDCIDLNDSDRASFAEIADFLEANL